MNITLIDDHTLFAESVKKVLLLQPEIEQVETYNSAETFLQSNGKNMPDIIITDLMMPGIKGMKLLDTCRELYKKTVKMIVLSSVHDVQTIKQAIRAGALAFLSKATSIDELREAISEVTEGRQYISKDLRNSLVNSVFVEEQIVLHLSPREQDVLHKVCSGLTIKEIAFDLHLSVHTVQSYYRNVMAKLNVKRTADLIVFAMQHGLYVPDVN